MSKYKQEQAETLQGVAQEAEENDVNHQEIAEIVDAKLRELTENLNAFMISSTRYMNAISARLDRLEHPTRERVQ